MYFLMMIRDMDSDICTFFTNDIGLNSINLNNVNSDYDNLDDCDPETKMNFNKLKQRKSCKKSKGLIPVLVDLRTRGKRNRTIFH